MFKNDFCSTLEATGENLVKCSKEDYEKVSEAILGCSAQSFQPYKYKETISGKIRVDIQGNKLTVENQDGFFVNSDVIVAINEFEKTQNNLKKA